MNGKLCSKKRYLTQEEHDKRAEIFEANSKLIEQHNSEGHSWVMQMNQFGDLTPKEFDALQTLYPSTLGTSRSSAPRRHKSIVTDIPASIDWRDQGLVTPVKNQGSCGSCWTFSTVVSYEGQVAKKTGTLTSFSEQNLVDCVVNQVINGSTQVCCMGCQGGLMDYAFAYMMEKQSGKDDTEASYAYEGKDGTCRFNPSNTVNAPVQSYTDIIEGNENDLQNAVGTVGPVSVAVDANMFWQFYAGGLFNPLFCDGKKLNHGVAVVGYGNENGKDYWIVKNSWGSTWGKQGYMTMVMGKNLCGVSNAAVYPNL